MTISVTIKHDNPESEKALEVRAVDPLEGSVVDSRFLLPGDEVVMSIHQGSQLVVEEVEE